jgi:hypothetical protein
MKLHFPKIVPDIPERVDFLKGLLNRNVEKRLGSGNNGKGFESEIKLNPFLKNIDWELVKEKKLIPSYKPNKNGTNVSSSVLLQELICESDNLEYKPRKKKKDLSNSNPSFSQKLSKSFTMLLFGKEYVEEQATKRTREQNEKDQMDEYWIDYDYEMPNQSQLIIPSKKKKASHVEDQQKKISVALSCTELKPANPSNTDGCISVEKGDITEISKTTLPNCDQTVLQEPKQIEVKESTALQSIHRNPLQNTSQDFDQENNNNDIDDHKKWDEYKKSQDKVDSNIQNAISGNQKEIAPI